MIRALLVPYPTEKEIEREVKIQTQDHTVNGLAATD